MLASVKNLNPNKRLHHWGSRTDRVGISMKKLFTGYTFNQRVMQILLETHFLFRKICLAQETEYAQVLDQLLFSRTVYVSLKAAILRQIINATEHLSDHSDDINESSQDYDEH